MAALAVGPPRHAIMAMGPMQYDRLDIQLGMQSFRYPIKVPISLQKGENILLRAIGLQQLAQLWRKVRERRHHIRAQVAAMDADPFELPLLHCLLH